MEPCATVIRVHVCSALFWAEEGDGMEKYPEIYKCIKETDISKTYSMPKQRVKFRRPRRISAKQREAARERMIRINEQEERDHE